MLQLKFLHVSRDWRGCGLGEQLYRAAHAQARTMGAERLYVSATPSQRTIDFYPRLGFTVSASPDPELYALEPEDIHLEGPTA
nr:GNAT family N-acetyltransferase [Burkholderia pyrrocinia]